MSIFPAELPRRGVASDTRDAHASASTGAAVCFCWARSWACRAAAAEGRPPEASLLGAMGARDPLVIWKFSKAQLGAWVSLAVPVSLQVR